MRLIVRPPRTRHPSQDAVEEVEAAILADPRVEPAAWRGSLHRAAFYGASALFKAGADRALGAVPPVPRAPAGTGRRYVAVLMGPQFAKCLPQFARPADKAVYLFDAWPDAQDRIVRFVRQFAVGHVFVSASQSADSLRDRVDAEVHWMPEGIDPAPYHARPPAERDVDVLHLGRRYDAYHEQVVGPLAARGKTYLYERPGGGLVFPTRRAFADGLARAKVSVCVPSSVTHPGRAGGVETMTLRYLQSMASGCVVVGRAPAEMVRLFGYDPVVEIDAADPAGQILDVVDHIDRYADLVERNRQTVASDHTWARRWHAMAGVLWPS